MNPLFKIESYLKKSLAPFQLLQVIIAAICICIPVVLRVTDRDIFYPPKINPAAVRVLENHQTIVTIDPGKNPCCGKEKKIVPQLTIYGPGTPIIAIDSVWKDKCGFRYSLSDYANSSRSYIFGLLYCMAAMLFIFNGVAYIRRKEFLTLDRYGHWYNILIGIFLIGVVFSPQCDLPVLHIIFTSLFFLGNLIALFFSRTGEERKINRVIRILMGVIILIAIALTLPFIHLLTVLYAEWISLTLIGIHLIMIAVSTDEKKK